MGLKIFGTDPADMPQPRQSFADDVVGRFRSGYQIDGRPAALEAWRVTTGDPEVAEEIRSSLGGDEPQEWGSKGEDTLEIFTDAADVEILLVGASALRQRMVMWGRQKMIYASDGETITYPDERKGEPDPDADLTFAERKQKGQDGIGPVPQIEILFKIVGHEDLGIFKFQTGSWSMAQDIVREGIDDLLTDALSDSEQGAARATLALEVVSFIAKNGPRAGKEVRYTKPVLTIKGAA